MDFDSFKATINDDTPPQGVSAVLSSMWYQAKGDWDKAHKIDQSHKSPFGNWVHAYLHRVEGDLGNAAYWYNLAEKPVCKSSLSDEWDDIVMTLFRAE